MAPTSVLAAIEDKYSDCYNWGSEPDLGFIVYVSSSPECKKGLYPPIMTLMDYDIDSVGNIENSATRLDHVSELDLSDNVINDWTEVIKLLKFFPNLEFLNLSNNLLNKPLREGDAHLCANDLSSNLRMRKLVLNGNNLDWESAHVLAARMPQLEELHLSNNSLNDPLTPVFHHPNLRQLYLSCNPLNSFAAISRNLAQKCPLLEHLSLAECSVSIMDEDHGFEDGMFDLPHLSTLNISTTAISSWTEVDRICNFPKLTELRLQHCPVLSDLTAHERRMMLVARLPNVRILNGGDLIPDNEREDAERGFIRYYNAMGTEDKPDRYHELVRVHGELDPLVNIDFKPDTHVRVKVVHKEDVREEEIEVYQTVAQLKQKLHAWFGMPIQNMKVYYCDKDYGELAGPEEMKWPQKILYTYNVQNGDQIILDEKVTLPRLRTNSRSSVNSMGSPSPRIQTGLGDSPKKAITFSISPRNGFSFSQGGKKPAGKYSGPRNASQVARNLFSKTQKPKSPTK